MYAISKQLRHDIKKFKLEKKCIESVFIGGGTPSCVSAGLYNEYFEILNPYLSNSVEITSEANPNSASAEWIKEMINLGVNRISFGVQSFNEQKLKLLGRAHDKKTALQAINCAHNLGVQHISLDLIYGVQGDTQELLKSDINTALTLPIDHISAYALTLENNTKFSNKPQYTNPSVKLAKYFVGTISKHFDQYEISNFGHYKSVHNTGYWQGKRYLGIGAGAVGFDGITRTYPHKSIEKYIDEPLHVEIEKLSCDDLRIEKLFLGLRSYVGFESDLLNNEQNKRLQILLDENRLKKEGKKVYNLDYFLADEIALFLLD